MDDARVQEIQSDTQVGCDPDIGAPDTPGLVRLCMCVYFKLAAFVNCGLHVACPPGLLCLLSSLVVRRVRDNCGDMA